MKSTIHEIAKLAGVSIGTVDRVVNNRGRVKENTKKRIEKIIKELNYTPNVFARNLALDRLYKIAVIMPRLEQDGKYWLLPKIGIDQACKDLQNYKFNVEWFFYNKYSEISFKQITSKVLKRKFDGILLAPIQLETSKLFLKKIPKHTPFAIFDTEIPDMKSITTVHQNPYHGGSVAAHLMELIIQSPATIAVVRFLPETIHINERVMGFADYLAKRKDLKLIVTDIPENSPKSEVYKIFRTLLKEENKLKGIFVTGSHTFEVAEYLNSIKNHNKVYLVGFDLVPKNIEFMRKGIIDFLITQNPDQQGFKAVHSLFSHLVLREKVPKEINLPIGIITKENLDFHYNNIYSQSAK